MFHPVRRNLRSASVTVESGAYQEMILVSSSVRYPVMR
jgi:hypothetical protein